MCAVLHICECLKRTAKTMSYRVKKKKTAHIYIYIFDREAKRQGSEGHEDCRSFLLSFSKNES